MAARTHQMSDRLPWRIFGPLYAHAHPRSPDTSKIKNRAGLALPVELTGEPASKFLIDADEQAGRRSAMRAVCLACHSSSWVDGHFVRMENTIETTNEIDGEIKECFSIGPVEITEGHPPWIFCCRVATGLGYIIEMGYPMKGGEIPQKNLPSPDLSVFAIPGPVQGEPDGRPFGAMLCQAAHQMGVVVLDGHGGNLFLLFGKF